MKKVGIRQFKNRLSAYLRQVRRGSSFLVTDRGKPVARIAPPPAEPTKKETLEEILRRLAAEGHIRLATRPLAPIEPVPSRGKPASQMIIEDREGR